MDLKKSRTITISLSPTVVRVAQTTSAGFVEKVARQDVSKAAVDEALRRALTGFDTQKAAIVCVIPAEVATAKHLEVPSTDDEEIASILELQAARHTPFSKEEILVSYIKIGTPKPHFTRVLLVVVKRDAIKEKMAILKSVGLGMDTVLFAPEGVARFYAQALKGKKGEAPVALLDISLQSATFIVLSQGTAVMSRSIPVGIEHLVTDTQAPQQMVDEIKASLDAYEHEGNDTKPVRFYLTVNHAALAPLQQAMTDGLSVIVEALPYTNFIKATKAVQETLATSFADDPALDVIACGMTASKCQVELIPQEIRDQRSVSEKGRETLKTGILLLCALFLVGVGLLSKVYFKDQFFKKNLVEKYSEQQKDVENLETLIARTRVLQQYIATRAVPLEAVRELYRIVPSEIYLSAVNMDDAGTMSIQGVSESMSKVFNFVTALEESPLFEGVKTKSTSTKKDRGKEVAVFEITIQLTGESKGVPVKDNSTAAGGSAAAGKKDK